MTNTTLSKLLLCSALALAACGNSGSGGTTSGTGTGSSSGGTSSGAVLSGLIDGGFGPNCTPPSNYIGNNLNVGAYCQKGEGQCEAYTNLFCGADADMGNGNFCLKVCMTDADCGEYACCTGAAGQTTRGCVPVQCDINDGGTTCPPGD